ncbi:hypothetical protein CPB83DRAFT_856538 [Crepidotus variabilis]|uniref:Uncharacterized protein n=1 Tax=Crepidotus variabilis TaxID=179855 RepID=A0A9P6ED28_9AGAR|nr:hypothetical protein CPB83DRAFT_856538 [Crepidotus variabilis]
MISIRYIYALAFAVLTLGSAAAPTDTCTCPPDINGVVGVLHQAWNGGVQCAFPTGACSWDSSGTLLNTAQPNCQRYISPNLGCPSADKTGSPGHLVHYLLQVTCFYDTPDQEFCWWDGTGSLLINSSGQECALNMAPCWSS